MVKNKRDKKKNIQINKILCIKKEGFKIKKDPS